ncbi:MAG: aminoacyl-tRNA hydrolase [Dehalococcoidia bacterium]|jgi:PTH1 family peptidyl-tRNA hydrolase|nr:aminoacyl-tRNA hydrolase [Dehalococcoidia bacterium]MDP6226510.1 aminoacyl-tRNA hydrolase [Dehalococcoidia bacterium]MDP7201301.1 aminoacyl-tRNA hydrolase [Dehalococcoidia bacterium]MDP7509839.1 aminoacyl-tRNA hydrolase [Dehalococcoidia bacterium]HJN86835.1 aminoacyl-tRNA hydrolase [Dehalococcoidia bacterium]
MRLIIGLGNPGTRYRGTRHNIGFRCVDLLALKWGIRVAERRAKVVLGRGFRAGEEIVLAKPRSFMNNSGEGVAYLRARFASRPEDLVVIYDDMALPVGQLRLRPGGSDGGHRGVQSIIESLQTQDFPRIRLGIGAPPLEQDAVGYVLGRFSGEEETILAGALDSVVAAVDCILEEGIDGAMNRFNSKPADPSLT